MDFILSKAEESTPTLQFSDDETEENNDDSNFIDVALIEQESIHFYRDLTNLDHYPKFVGHTRNPIETTSTDTDDYFGQDDQPELYDPENSDFAEFDRFDKFEQNIKKFNSALLNFDGFKNYFFYAFIYGLMYQKTDQLNIKKDDPRKILCDELYFDLLEIEPSTMLDKSLFSHFERCFAINQVLEKYG